MEVQNDNIAIVWPYKADLNHDGICEVCFGLQIEEMIQVFQYITISGMYRPEGISKGKDIFVQVHWMKISGKALFPDSTICSDIDSSAATVKKLTFGSK